MESYKTTIGIEVHAELKTKSKMFCGCKNDPHDGIANSHICPVCLAHPGTLPAVNKDAIQKVLLVGRAIGGELSSTYSEFDRKNYFYPDIPKAYQLSQYAFPFVKGGTLAEVEITRIHLEEDTARSQHDQGEGSLVDFNRAGVPLMELVTEPVIHDSKTAANFGRELQILLRTLDVSNANMEKGEMRVEANISISKTDTLGTKVEVKNLNSFKAVEQAIEYEIKRQAELLEKGEEVVQETRGWDENKSKTFSQRIKETSEDYRYFPDPDIPKYKLASVEEMSISRIDEIMPELPTKIRTDLSEIGLKEGQIEVLIADSRLLTFYKSTTEVLGADNEKKALAANYITSDILGLVQNDTVKDLGGESAQNFAKLIAMISAGSLNSRTAKDLLVEVLNTGVDPEKVAKERGLLQSNSAEDLLPIIKTVLAENEGVVTEYKAGKESALQFLVGQGMKATRGTANPTLLMEILKQEMD